MKSSLTPSSGRGKPEGNQTGRFLTLSSRAVAKVRRQKRNEEEKHSEFRKKKY